MNVKLACTCCRPLVDLELLSCHHHGLRFLKNNKPSINKWLQMNAIVACTCCRPAVTTTVCFLENNKKNCKCCR